MILKLYKGKRAVRVLAKSNAGQREGKVGGR
jgi:hypothetical protein